MGGVPGFNPALKQLFMSGYPGEALAGHGVTAENLRLLQKPFTIEALAQRVREALDAPSERTPGRGVS